MKSGFFAALLVAVMLCFAPTQVVAHHHTPAAPAQEAMAAASDQTDAPAPVQAAAPKQGDAKIEGKKDKKDKKDN